MFALKLFFAGIGPLVAHWSIGIVVIAACVAGELFIGAIVSYLPLLKPATRQIQLGLLAVAVGTALVLLGEWLGAKDMAGRCEAKAAVVTTTVHKAVTDANGNTAKRDKWDTDK